jgi:hypothetical protein
MTFCEVINFNRHMFVFASHEPVLSLSKDQAIPDRTASV